jgi:hypothetical protein
MSRVYDDINKLYNKMSFTGKYGSDIWATIIIFSIVILGVMYFHTMNNIKPIVADWENQRCSPVVIPFAGLINNGPNTTPFEYTGQNFTNCIQTILASITGDAFSPIYYIVDIITDTFKDIMAAIVAIRAEFDKVRNSISGITGEIMGRALNVVLPVVKLMISIKDMMAKMLGSLTGGLFLLFGSYMTLQSLILGIVELLISILTYVAGVLAALFIIACIPLIGIPAEIALVPMTVIFFLILVPTILIKITMDDAMNMSFFGCFAGDTLIPLAESGTGTGTEESKGAKEKRIADIKIGDILIDGAAVTAIIKYAAQDQQVFSLNGVTVTGEHRVLAERGGWIKVKNHPNSINITSEFKEPFVYCLNTTSKTFLVGTTLFSDWDDIDEDVLAKITKNAFKNNLPANFDIHAYLDSGIKGGTGSLVELADGRMISIDQVEVNQKLKGGERVLGTVIIDAQNLEGGIYTYRSVIGQEIQCSQNLYIALDGLSEKEPSVLNTNTNEKYLYQLLTTTGKFTINGIIVGDYNSGIDQYLNLEIYNRQ